MEGQTGFRLSDQYLQLKSRLHRHLIGQIEERDLQIADWPRTKLRQFVDEHVRRYVVEQRLPVNTREASGLAQDVEDELLRSAAVAG